MIFFATSLDTLLRMFKKKFKLKAFLSIVMVENYYQKYRLIKINKLQQ